MVWTGAVSRRTRVPTPAVARWAATAAPIRRSRDAATLFAHVYTAGGLEGRDAVWSHPDLLPDAQDLDNPSGYFARREAQQAADQEFDAALADFLKDE